MKDQKKLGIIGRNISYSFSQKYYEDKFKRLMLTQYSYDVFDLKEISEVEEIFQDPALIGFNVTIPYKEKIIPFLDELNEEAAAIGAVNTIKFINGKKIGYNSDCYGFEMSLKPLLKPYHTNALILGTGGASKAVEYVLKKLGISFQYVSRNKSANTINYDELDELIIHHSKLIINSTPLGMYPNIENSPDISYDFITDKHLLFDLIYNPEETQFLKEGKQRGAQTKNGLEMLYLQAEKSWEIWNSR